MANGETGTRGRTSVTAIRPDYNFEKRAARLGAARAVGVDEVGRGPLAGPVTAAAVWLDPGCIPEGLDDSKALTAAARERLHDILMDCADVSVAHATVAEIDEHNILRASHIAMCRAIEGLRVRADYLLIDGNQMPRGLSCRAELVVSGDARVMSIAAASIVAKVVRDRHMAELAQEHPHYGWERNAGYPTEAHREALLRYGVSPHHRRSFRPVHNILYPDTSVTS